MPAPRITNSGRPLSEKDLDTIETKLGASLPASYRRFLRAHNGGNPEPSAWGRTNSVHVFFGFKPRMRMYDLFVNQQTLGEWLPSQLLPIACGPFGDAFCLAIKGKNRGKVYFWDHEEPPDDEDGPEDVDLCALYPEIDWGPPDPDEPEKPIKDDWPGYRGLTRIADSFDEFLDSFHDIDEQELLAEAKKTQTPPVNKVAKSKKQSAIKAAATKKPAAAKTKPVGAASRPAAAKSKLAGTTKKPTPKKPAATKRAPRGRGSK